MGRGASQIAYFGEDISAAVGQNDQMFTQAGIDLSELLENPSKRNLPSEAQIATETAALALAMSSTILTDGEYDIYKAIQENPSAKQYEIGESLSLSKSSIGTNSDNIRSKIRDALDVLAKEEGQEFLARDFLLMHFFPELSRQQTDKQEQLQKLEEAGIVFRDDGRVDLSNSTNNRFYTTVFKTVRGEYISGLDMLKLRSKHKHKLRAVNDLFKHKYVREGLIIEADEQEKPSDILANLRSPESIQDMQRKFVLYLRSDGKWHISARTEDFLHTRWCKLDANSEPILGITLLRRLNLDCTQPGIGEFFAMIFGEDNLHFVERTGVGRLLDYLGEEEMMRQLRSKRNLAAWADEGVKIPEAGEDKVIGIPKNGFTHKSNAKFKLDGLVLNRTTALKDVLEGNTAEDVKKLCERVWTGYKFVFIEAQAKAVEKPSSKEEIMADLRQPGNMEILERYAMKHEEDKLLLAIVDKKTGIMRDLNSHDFSGAELQIQGKTVQGLDQRLRQMGEGRGFGVLVALYKELFGKDKIITRKELPDPSPEQVLEDLKNPRNKRILRSLVKPYNTSDPRLFVNLLRKDIKGHSVVVGFRAVSLVNVLLLNLEWGVSKQAIARLYREIFGEENIVTLDDLKEENAGKLKNFGVATAA